MTKNLTENISRNIEYMTHHTVHKFPIARAELRAGLPGLYIQWEQGILTTVFKRNLGPIEIFIRWVPVSVFFGV
jgi:hypothetical protein